MNESWRGYLTENIFSIHLQPPSSRKYDYELHGKMKDDISITPEQQTKNNKKTFSERYFRHRFGHVFNLKMKGYYKQDSSYGFLGYSTTPVLEIININSLFPFIDECFNKWTVPIMKFSLYSRFLFKRFHSTAVDENPIFTDFQFISIIQELEKKFTLYT